VQEFFGPSVEIELVFWAGEAVAFVGVDHESNFAAVFADGVYDLFRLRELYPRIIRAVADQQRQRMSCA